MINMFRRAFGMIKVTQLKDEVLIEGVPGHFITNDITNIWRTNRLANFMFNKVTKNTFSVPNFFLLDLLYAMERILFYKKKLGISKKTAQEIIDALKESTWLGDIDKHHDNILNFDKLDLFWKTPLSFQMDFYNKYNYILPRYKLNGYLLAGTPGSGKAQPLDAGIKIPGGWSTMGDMKIGTKVIAKDGSTTFVTGVFPQGVKEIFRITFGDGRSTECCEEHLWTVIRRTSSNEQHREVLNIKGIIELRNRPDFHNRVYIDLIDPEVDSDIDLPMDPYTLGVLLGDGCLRNTINIATADEFILKEIEKTLPINLKINRLQVCTNSIVQKDYQFGNNIKTNQFREILKDLGLLNSYSYDKFIPNLYLNASTEQRLALLQGLMDTDGTVSRIGGTVSYCSSSEELSKGVQYLVRSLGGIASISTRLPMYTYKGELLKGRRAYQVNIRFKKSSDLFRLPRKKERTIDNGQYSATLKLRIDNIESIGYKPAQCISIDHPDKLYITDDFIVTHNTLISLTLSEMLEVDHVFVVCPANALYNVWEKSIRTEYKEAPTCWVAADGKNYTDQKYLLFHYEALHQAVAMASRFSSKKIAIILDECHNLNNDESLRTKLFIDLCDKTQSKNIVWASGTPIKAMGSETIPLFRTIDPTFTDSLKLQYKKVYGKDAKKALDILSNRLDIVTHKIEKHELGLQAPIIENYLVTAPGAEQFTLDKIKNEMTTFITERIKYYKSNFSMYEKIFKEAIEIYRKNIRSSIEEKDLNTYLNLVKEFQKNTSGKYEKSETSFCNRFEKEFIMPTLSKDLKDKFQDAKSVIKYLQLKVQGECLGRVLGKRRMECIKLIAENINYAELIETSTKKSLVFTSYVEVLEKAAEITETLGLQPAVVYAKTNHMLTSIIKEFEINPKVNPLIATFNSLSTAVPLVMADTEILLNAPFRDYILQQTIARINRLGADTQSMVYIAILDTGNKPNLSTRSVDILKWSQSQVSAIMGIESPFQIEETGVIATEGISLENISSLDPDDEFHISFENLIDKEYIL